MTPLGPFAVRAEPAEVAAFRTVTGLPPGDTVPATFPMRWLAAPEVRDALLAMAAEPDLVPVHESQMFDYLVPLNAGEDYQMRLDAHRESAPERLVLTGIVTARSGAVHLRIETMLRLFSTVAVAA